jgi:Holliday junction DNA helicase RuvA
MIASVSGKVNHVEQGSVVVEVGGVGFLVHVPTPVSDQLEPGEAVFLHTQLVVRQDSLTLFGFDSTEGREFFNLLLGVNGIGPRLALSMLSTLTPDAIRRAVFNEQADVFTRARGWQENSPKILLSLQDRVSVVEGLAPIAAMSDVAAKLAALIGLGYSVVEAQSVLQSIPKDAPGDVESRLRIALQYFS